MQLVRALAALALAVTAALALWPLHGNGVSGNALAPHVHGFGWYGYAPMPEHPTAADFHRAGITRPQDVVHRRRTEVAGAATVAAVLATAATAATVVVRRRRAG